MHRLGESAFEGGLAIEWGHVEFGAYLDVVGKDTAVLGPDIVRGILEEEVNAKALWSWRV